MEVFSKSVLVYLLIFVAIAFSYERSFADSSASTQIDLPLSPIVADKRSEKKPARGSVPLTPVKDCRFDLFVDSNVAQATDPQARYAGEALISCLDLTGQPVELDLGVRFCPHGEQDSVVPSGPSSQLGVRDNPIKAMQNQKITDIYGKYALGFRREEVPNEAGRLVCIQKTVGDPGASLNISFLARIQSFAVRSVPPMGSVRVYLYNLLDSIENPSEYTCAKLDARYFEPVRPKRHNIDEPRSVFDMRDGI